MQRKQTCDLEQFDSEVASARRCAIKALDGYGCSLAEIMNVLAVSKATFYRCDTDPKPSRRSVRRVSQTRMSLEECLDIAVVALIREEKYAVTVIAYVLGLSDSSVYRKRRAYYERLNSTSNNEESRINDYLNRRIGLDIKSAWQFYKGSGKRRCGFSPRKND